MTTNNISFHENLALLDKPELLASLKDIRHGVERETLRVENNGTLAMNKHQMRLGSALCNEWITTDFSESLLEFITPPQNSYKTSLQELRDIHKFTYESIGEQLLWPISMPCFIDSKTLIPIAKYGSSNIAKMKEVYRQGLHNRYGSMMQVIAGVHFNFSLPDRFWQLWCDSFGKELNKQEQSSYYFGLIRNFRRLAWVIPYLYGASPALCGSFIAHKNVKHDFQKLGKGTLYLPYATSLRMSDLGYTSSAQSSLQICTNQLDSYVKSLRAAMNQKAPQYQHLSFNDKDGWEQLNDNVLQIENELYSSIRPKQVAKSLEMPSCALQKRGVSYLEVRSLDVNPYSPVGIDAEQFQFLDVFLLYCLLLPSPEFSDTCHKISQDNINKTVLEGRKPNLLLHNFGEDIALQDWGAALSKDLHEVAKLLDKANSTQRYTQAVSAQSSKFNQAETTPSGLWLSTMLENNIDNSMLGLELAKEYKHASKAYSYTQISQEQFKLAADTSRTTQQDIESADKDTFADFVQKYFSSAY